MLCPIGLQCRKKFIYYFFLRNKSAVADPVIWSKIQKLAGSRSLQLQRFRRVCRCRRLESGNASVFLQPPFFSMDRQRIAARTEHVCMAWVIVAGVADR
ncbi:hypothetical protein [Methylomonas koyamae]|uniref:hypothetical protein n=1 Tax=Methylomonas koyamae TaxID=702114 RepID=UPI0018D38260|nr:hypothetical protein [Methylomonas koyamae]